MAINVAALVWTEGATTYTLTNGNPGPAGRFALWTPVPGVLQSEAQALTGKAYGFQFADLYDATLQLERIPNGQQPLAARLVRHLRRFGVVQAETGDAADRVYPACQAVKDAPPRLTLADPRLLEWTLALTLRNVAAAPVEMLCLYGEPPAAP